MNYRLLVDFEVRGFMATLCRTDQILLRKRFMEIRDWPSRCSDYREQDDTGRPVDISICGKFAIKYWDDFADRHVKVLDVHLADKAPRPGKQ